MDRVERNQNTEKAPGSSTRKQQRIATTRVIEKKALWLLERRGRERDLPQSPDEESEKAHLECVPSEGKEGHQQHQSGSILEANHAIWREGQAEIVDHSLRGIYRPVWDGQGCQTHNAAVWRAYVPPCLVHTN
jgi:hypothetical protein